MKISLNWLKEFVDIQVDADTLAERLSLIGLEVAAVERVHPGFEGVVVAQVETVSPHPDADNLRICQVKAGGGERLQIVCGAPNAEPGMKAPLIRVGGRLADGTQIKRSRLRGIDSEGMLCSAVELGLAEAAEGLMSLPAEAEPGQTLESLLQLDDTVIDIELTPNRGDCLSVLGVAREVAAIFDQELRLPETTAVPPRNQKILPVTVAATEACPRFSGRTIHGMNPEAATPLWMQERLRRAGIRPISPAVDVTQYVLLELGQPMHAYDLATIQKGIVVRDARAGEPIRLLEGREVTLEPDMLVIADHERVLGLAGIMGGVDSAVQTGTTDIYLECAYFLPAKIQGRGRRLALQTDAGYRFERGVDPEGQRRALERATALLLAITGGEPGPVDETVSREHLPVPKPVELRQARLGHVLGIDIPAAEVSHILERLGMTVSKTAAGWQVTPPGYRFDIAIEPDLIEEVIRIHGYDRIPIRHFPLPQEIAADPEQPAGLVRLREVLVQRGYFEAVTYSFVDRDWQERLCGEAGLALANPITSDMTHMRSSLWPGLLQTLDYNRNRQQERVRLFETGLKFISQGNEIEQKNVVAGLLYGSLYPPQWGVTSRLVDFADLKNDLEALFALAGAESDWQMEPASHPALHPGQSAAVYRDGMKVGVLGALHPAHQQALELMSPAWLFELELEAISSDYVPVYRQVSRYPSVRRDLAVVLPQSVSASAVIDSIHNSVTNMVHRLETDIDHKLELFDVYQGEGIDLGKKSLAIGLTFQKSSSTLIDTEVDTLVATALSALKQTFGAELRE